MERTIRWGMIGCGNVCEVKSGPGFYKACNSSLVAVGRRDGDKARDYAKRHGVLRAYDSGEAVIADPEVDAVYVATPVGTHAAYAVAAAQAGKPCYVEKPMARNYAECLAMIEAFEQAGVPLFVAFYRRAMDRFTTIKTWLEAGRLGRISSARITNSSPRHRRIDPQNPEWRLTAEQGGGGLVLDLGSHALDLLDFLLGPATQVAGEASNRAGVTAVEDTVAMSAVFGQGIPFVGQWNFASDRTEDELLIVGTEGWVRTSVFGQEPVELKTAAGLEQVDLPYPEHVQQQLIQSIVDQLLGRGSCPSTGESGARTSAVLDEVLKSYYGGRQDAFWERPEQWPGKV